MLIHDRYCYYIYVRNYVLRLAYMKTALFLILLYFSLVTMKDVHSRLFSSPSFLMAQHASYKNSIMPINLCASFKKTVVS
jgi:hypothetical protein